jgi:hypothetical protein
MGPFAESLRGKAHVRALSEIYRMDALSPDLKPEISAAMNTVSIFAEV